MNPPEAHEFDEMTEDRPFEDYSHFSTWLHLLKMKRTQMKIGLKIICFTADEKTSININLDSLLCTRHELYITKKGKVYKIKEESRDMEVFNGQN